MEDRDIWETSLYSSNRDAYVSKRCVAYINRSLDEGRQRAFERQYPRRLSMRNLYLPSSTEDTTTHRNPSFLQICIQLHRYPCSWLVIHNVVCMSRNVPPLPFIAFSTPAIWSDLLCMSRVYERVGVLIILVTEMVKGVLPFLILLGMLIVGETSCMLFRSLTE